MVSVVLVGLAVSVAWVVSAVWAVSVVLAGPVERWCSRRRW